MKEFADATPQEIDQEIKRVEFYLRSLNNEKKRRKRQRRRT